MRLKTTQIEQAAKTIFENEPCVRVSDIYKWSETSDVIRHKYRLLACSAAAFTQAPLDAPTPEEVKTFATRIAQHAGSVEFAVKNVLGEFIESRNEAIINPPQNPLVQRLSDLLRDKLRRGETITDIAVSIVEMLIEGTRDTISHEMGS